MATPPPVTTPPATHGPGFSWASASDRELDIAAVFLTARQAGVRRALDSLVVLAARDKGLRDAGHVVAHELGQFAVARSGYDPRVYAQCSEVFHAGCWHGVMEGYFASPRGREARAVEPAAVNALCASIAGAATAARLPILECAHGMGHGLAARFGGDIYKALGVCDALTAADARRECHDGVFMENAVKGTESPQGTSESHEHGHAGSHGALVRRGDLRFPCDSVDARYQPACWSYQPIIAMEFTGNDAAKTIRICEQAPPASAGACYRGVGKQSTGWYPDEPRNVVIVCRHVPAAYADACYAGAVEAYIDEMWRAEPAMAFCRIVPRDAKAGCERTIKERMALVRGGS